MTDEVIAVLGGGTMGRGIAQVAAAHGVRVHVVEPSSEQRDRARAAIERSLRRQKSDDAAQGRPEEILERLQWFDELDPAVAEATFVIEAVPESESLKRSIFGRLDEICTRETILASNTSSISLTRIAAATQRPQQVVGMHFFNPVPVMAPVEIVQGLETSGETVARTRALAERMGKQPFEVADAPGFVVNRVLMPLINEAVFALQEGVADAESIDALTKLGLNHPMGPLRLADLIGLDVCLDILRVLHGELGDPKFRPCPLLVRMVDAGRLGRKAGRGFYDYGTEA